MRPSRPTIACTLLLALGSALLVAAFCVEPRPIVLTLFVAGLACVVAVLGVLAWVAGYGLRAVLVGCAVAVVLLGLPVCAVVEACR